MMLDFTKFRINGKTLLLAFAGAVVFFASLAVNSRGIYWPELHPDEHKIAVWMEATKHAPYIQERVYPEGLFRIAKCIGWGDKEKDKVFSHVESWTFQNGFGNGDELKKGCSNGAIYRVRVWNAHFIAWSAFFVFLTTFVILRRTGLSLVAGLLYALHPFVVEHAHYAETDAAMLFTGTLALLLMTVALKTSRLLLFAVSSLVAGFAVATKFSLAPLVFLVPLNSVLIARRRNLGTLKTVGFALAMVALWCAGFLLGTPKLALAPSLFFEQAAMTGARTYGEMRALLGEAASRPHAATLFKLRSILAETSKCSWYWWLFCALPAVFWFCRRFRPVISGLPLFGGTYLLYALFFFPWFRNQELLPILPLCAVSAVLPLYLLMDVRERKRRVIGAVLASIALAAAAGWTFIQGMRMSSAFSASETRYAVAKWLDECAPSGRRYIFEQYAAAGLPIKMARMGAFEMTNMRKVELMSLKDWNQGRFDYFMTAPDMAGRGTIDPATGTLFPSRQRVYDAIMTNAVKLAAWHTDSRMRPMFAQVGVELYANAVTNTPGLDLSVPPERPIVIKSDRYGNPLHRISSGSGIMGPIQAVGVVGKRTRIEFDPYPQGGKFYAVAVSLVGPDDVDVSWDGGFVPRRQKVPRGRAVLFISDDSLNSPLRFIPSARVRMHGDDQRNMCVMVVTDSPAVAAQVLRRFGNDAEAAQLCPQAGADYRKVAQVSGEDAFSARLSFRGIPDRVVEDFACFRHGPVPFTVASRTMDPRQVHRDGFLYAEFPYVLDEGEYRLSLSFKPAWGLSKCLEDGKAKAEKFPRCHLYGAELLAVQPQGLNASGELVVDFHVRGHSRFSPFYLGIEAENGEVIYEATYAQLSWSPVDAVRRMAGNAAETAR